MATAATTVPMMCFDAAALQRHCVRRWGLRVVLAEGAQARLVDMGVSLASAMAGIAELVAVSMYANGVLEIDVRDESDGSIPAAALSMLWI